MFKNIKRDYKSIFERALHHYINYIMAKTCRLVCNRQWHELQYAERI